jgi:hypothetical protein
MSDDLWERDLGFGIRNSELGDGVVECRKLKNKDNRDIFIWDDWI